MNECVLVVDDDREIVKAIALLLEKEGYRVLKAYDGMEALELVAEQPVRLIIMDVMMPKLDGLSAVMKIRERKNLPIIVLSAKSEDTDKVLGLSMGADDYVSKPFNPQELAARVKSHLRRYTLLGDINAQRQEDEIENGRLCYRMQERTLYADGEPVKLTATETKIVDLLMRNRGRIFPAEEIYRRVWEEDAFAPENTVMVHIRRIREKIELNPKEPEYLKVVWELDTKWRKSKIILSFTAFFLGITLLFGNFFSMIGLIASQDGDTLADRVGEDYQGTAEFCWYMSNRLEDLLGVATGGKGWNSYGVTYGGDGYYYYKDYFDGYSSWYFEDTVASSEENVAEVVPEPPEEISQEQAAEGGYGYYKNEMPEGEILARHMKELAGDKNVLYAVVYQGKLLYTNIADVEEKIGKEVGNYDFSNNVSPEEYNFCLWYNLTGDGKVQITKDGQSVDVYGDGVYTEDSRWYVPGYTNFSVDPSTKDAVIFLAAAKEPKLYVVGNYSEYGTVHQGGRLYYMQKTQQERHRRYETGMIAISAAVLLLILAFFMRKSRKAADEAIAGLLRKIWLELKVLLFVGIPLVVFWYNGREVLRELMWMLSEADGWYMMEEVFWYLGRFARNGVALAVAFWMIYLAVVDHHYNKGRQKKLFAPVAAALSRRSLELPVAKRIVSRYYPVLILSLLFPFFGITAVFGNFLYLGWREISRTTSLFLALLAIVSGAAFVAATVLYLRRNKQLAEELDALSAQIADVRNGNLTKPLELSADADLKRAAENLNEIQQGMETALKEQTKSERMKVELVANVSHDIKTPLTSIVSYVELLKQEEELPEHVKEYVQILGEKSERLKTMVQDVFEISKAASNQLPVNMERLDLGKLLRQTLADMNGQILESGLVLKTSLPEAPVLILADGQRLYRVFQNLIQNALKYSLKGSRIFLTLTEEGKTAVASIKNTSGLELESGVDFTERFVRGDISRTDGGSGLGLSIAKSFTEACGGSFSVDVNADLFTVTVAFARISGE